MTSPTPSSRPVAGEETTRDRPLSIAIEGESLVIRIGVATLAFAAEHGEHVQETAGPFRVIDADELARDVIRELGNDYQLDAGCSVVERLLDTAIVAAISNGSLAVNEGGDDA